MPPPRLPAPPYYAAIFWSQRSEEDPEGYETAADEMAALASRQPGFLGIESVRGPDGAGVTVSYWESEDAIAQWRDNAAHAARRAQGRAHWYTDFSVQIAKVERAYDWSKDKT